MTLVKLKFKNLILFYIELENKTYYKHYTIKDRHMNDPPISKNRLSQPRKRRLTKINITIIAQTTHEVKYGK